MTLVDHRHAAAPDHSNAPPSSSSRLSGYIDDDHEPRNRVEDVDGFLARFKLGYDQEKDNNNPNRGDELFRKMKETGMIPEDADDIFRKMKETGLIPNAMLMIFEDLFRSIQAKLAKNKRVNERVGNVANARVFDLANERVVNVNSVVNDVVNDVNRVNAFSAMDELDGSSWDDIQTPDRTKKAKTSGFPVASKQTHSTASNAVNAGIPPVVHLPVRMSSRTPSPMQVREYVGGLSFLFEWKSKDIAVKNIEDNRVWLQHWFDDIKPWEDSELPVGRLVWLNVEGLPALGRHIRAVKAIVKDFGRVLEVGRLDFDAKILPPVKILLFVQCMEEICQSIDVSLNGKIFPVKVYEDRSPVFNLLSPSSDVEDEYSFEEEFVGPSIDIIGDGEGCPYDHDSNLRDIEESPIQSRSPEKGVPHGASPQSYNNFSPLASELPPPPIGPHPAESSMSEEVVQPTLDVVVDRPNSLDVNSPNSIKSNPDLNMNLGLGTDVSDDDKELEDVFGSFERISQNVILGSQTNVGKESPNRRREIWLLVVPPRLKP
ncbi:hypothetical protein Tco_0609537 [Tanacetum coccineum]